MISGKVISSFFVGTYRHSGGFISEANGQGLVTCYINILTGEMSKRYVNRDIINSSYLYKVSQTHILFSIDDRFSKPGTINVFKADKLGRIKLIDAKYIPGSKDLCHVSANVEGTDILISSYGSGQLFHYRFLNEELYYQTVFNFTGHGPKSDRQESSHIHQALFYRDGKSIYICDLGSDRIWIQNLYKEELRQYIKVPDGYGPRHLSFHPQTQMLFVFCELSPNLLVFKIRHYGESVLVDNISTLLDGCNNIPPSGSAIRVHPSEKTLFIANRSNDSISVFTISENNSLTFSTNFETRGKEPRDFNFDPSGNWIIVANQESDNIISFRLDPKNGIPTGDIGSVIECGSPVCVEFNL